MFSLSTADAVTLAAAPVLMVVVSLFERRWGPVVGGIVAAAPVTAIIGLLLVSSNFGQSAGVEMALSMSGYAPAQVAAAVVVIVLVRRTGLPLAIAAGTASYGALAWISLHVPAPVAALASVVTLVVTLRMMREPGSTDDVAVPALPGSSAVIAVRAAVSLITALALLVAADQFGPAAGGAVGSYPIFTVTLCVFLYATAGALGVQRMLFGMVHGLPAYLAFVLCYALVAAPAGPLVASIVATLACCACYVLPVIRFQRNRRTLTGNDAHLATA